MLSDVYAQAKEHLLEHGWFGRNGSRAGGTLCLGMAIARATEPNDRVDAMNFMAGEVLHQPCLETERQDFGVIRWNDERGRTFDEVMDALDQAIVKAKERERDTT